MIVDLQDFIPKNESKEHFILKQVARAFLFQNGVRCIGTEVEFRGHDHSPFGQKVVADVIGIDRRRKFDEKINQLFLKIQDKAIEYGMEEGITEPKWNDKHYFRNYYPLRGEERIVLEKSIEMCFEKACLFYGFARDFHHQVRYAYKDEWTIRSVEAKASLSDFRNGFSLTAEYSYIIAPVGIIPKVEIPPKVGLLEFDFDKFHQTREWQKALKVSKKPKKIYDSMFYEDIEAKKGFKNEVHKREAEHLLFIIAQQNTEEHIFWNPHIKSVQEGYHLPVWTRIHFEYKIAQETPLGIVVERRLGKNPEYNSNNAYYSIPKEVPFYKLIVPNVGITKKWISEKEIQKSFHSQI